MGEERKQGEGRRGIRWVRRENKDRGGEVYRWVRR